MFCYCAEIKITSSYFIFNDVKHGYTVCMMSYLEIYLKWVEINSFLMQSSYNYIFLYIR